MGLVQLLGDQTERTTGRSLRSVVNYRYLATYCLGEFRVERNGADVFQRVLQEAHGSCAELPEDMLRISYAHHLVHYDPNGFGR